MSIIIEKCAQAELLLQENKKEEARNILKELEHIPFQSAEEYNRAALLAYQLGHFNIALNLFLEAIKLNPNDSAYHSNVGLTYLKQGNYQEAKKAFEISLKINPKNANTIHNLGVLYENQLELEKAKSYFEKEKKLQPDSPLPYAGLANIAHKQSNQEDVIKFSDKCLEKAPSFSEVKAIKASALRKLGKIEESYELIQETIKENPNSVVGNYEMGHHLHLQEEYDKAIAHFKKANELQDIHIFSREQFLHEVKEIHTFLDKLATTDLINNQVPLSQDWPIFIISSPRSGTTLLSQMLGMHSKLYNEGELNFISRLYTEANYRLRSPNHVRLILESIWHPENQGLTTLLRNQYQEFLKPLYSTQHNLWAIDKMPANIRKLSMITKICPGAPFINIIRDGREVAFSALTQNFKNYIWHSHNLIDALIEWKESIILARKSAKILKAPYLEVRYERLVTHPKEELMRIFDFLSLEWEEQCLEFYNSKNKINTASFEQVKKKLYSSSISKAKKYTKAYEEMTEYAKDFLIEMGYETD